MAIVVGGGTTLLLLAVLVLAAVMMMRAVVVSHLLAARRTVGAKGRPTQVLAIGHSQIAAATYTISDVTGLQMALDSKALDSDVTTAFAGINVE